jgi:hypothetical protein
VENHFGQNWQQTEGRQGKMTEKLYLYDVVDATPRFFVRGRTVCRLTSGEAVYVIDGDEKTMTPAGADKPVFKIQGGWVVACGRAVLWSPDMDRILAAAGQKFDVTNMVAWRERKEGVRWHITADRSSSEATRGATRSAGRGRRVKPAKPASYGMSVSDLDKLMAGRGARRLLQRLERDEEGE